MGLSKYGYKYLNWLVSNYKYSYLNNNPTLRLLDPCSEIPDPSPQSRNPPPESPRHS